jgi:hypothetical protein
MSAAESVSKSIRVARRRVLLAVSRLRKAAASIRIAYHLRACPDVHAKFGPHYKRALRAIWRASRRRGARKAYVIGSVLAALQAKNCGRNRVALIEFGVATGGGLRAMMDIADCIRREMQMDVSVIGFDNRFGLPEPSGYRDHPEIWSKNQFAMDLDYKRIDEEVRARGGELVIGDVRDTLESFELGDRVLAFASIDVDYYTSTLPITEWLRDLRSSSLLPASVLYFDDVLSNWTYSSHAGEALAIAEFNESSDRRKIELKHDGLHLYALHDLAHPIRTGEEKSEVPLEIFLSSLMRYHV